MSQEQASPRVITWEEIVREHPRWREAYEAAQPDEQASRALASVAPGAQVTIILATWCGDSRREVARLQRALELAQPVPFTLRMSDVPRGFREDPDLAALDIRFVPTLIVSREGVEVGRIVESSPRGVEHDLGELLRGELEGVITMREEL